jgi:hypothetical protein
MRRCQTGHNDVGFDNGHAFKKGSLGRSNGAAHHLLALHCLPVITKGFVFYPQ